MLSQKSPVPPVTAGCLHAYVPIDAYTRLKDPDILLHGRSMIAQIRT